MSVLYLNLDQIPQRLSLIHLQTRTDNVLQHPVSFDNFREFACVSTEPQVGQYVLVYYPWLEGPRHIRRGLKACAMWLKIMERNEVDSVSGRALYPFPSNDENASVYYGENCSEIHSIWRFPSVGAIFPVTRQNIASIWDDHGPVEANSCNDCSAPLGSHG